MTVSTAANALNLIGNAILIYGFGLEVLGAGLATLASRILGAVIMLYKLLRPDCRVGMRSFGDLRFQKEMFGRILRIGIPSGLESAAFNIGKLLVASLVSTLVGGDNIGEVILGRERYPINLRFPRDLRDNVDALRVLRRGRPSLARNQKSSTWRPDWASDISRTWW